MSFFKFLISKAFWKQLLFMFLIAVFLCGVVFLSLKWYTHHGQTFVVPDFTDKQPSELSALTTDYGFQFEIIDSVFVPKKDAGAIVKQDPAPNSQVKKGRRFYLTVAASHPGYVNMPNLVDLSLRQATSLLETYDLSVGKLEFIPHFANNAVFAQKYQGEPILADQQIQRGSKIDLVIGRGTGGEMVVVPFLVGLTKQEAIRQLMSSALYLGSETILDEDEDEAYLRVYSQQPQMGKVVAVESRIDLTFRSDRMIDFEKVKEEAETEIIEGQSQSENEQTN